MFVEREWHLVRTEKDPSVRRRSGTAHHKKELVDPYLVARTQYSTNEETTMCAVWNEWGEKIAFCRNDPRDPPGQGLPSPRPQRFSNRRTQSQHWSFPLVRQLGMSGASCSSGSSSVGNGLGGVRHSSENVLVPSAPHTAIGATAAQRAETGLYPIGNVLLHSAPVHALIMSFLLGIQQVRW